MALSFSRLGLRQKQSEIARLMTVALQRPDLLSLAAGFTDNDTLPLSEVGSIVSGLEAKGELSTLQYGANQGDPALRQTLTARLAAQDGSADLGIESSLITNGSQQALYLAVQTLCDEGDIVLVEEPTYFVFLELLRGLGVEPMAMPMRDDGEVDVAGLRLQLQNLEREGRLSRVKAMYLVSYYANPSGHSISRSSKIELLDLLEEQDGRIALFEDAAYRELYFEKPYEAESFLALRSAGSEVAILYSTTLTKPYASGLKVGYSYCTDESWLARMLAVKGQQDFGTANFNQAILREVIANGLLDNHLQRIRSVYQKKMEIVHHALAERLVDLGWNWGKPEGGLYIWASAPEDLDTGFDSDFHQRCLDHGVLYVPGELCSARRTLKNKVRLSYGVLKLSDLAEASNRFIESASAVAVS